MLRGEGNAGERWKTTIGLIRKKQLFTCSPVFLYISLPLFCTTTTWNFQKLLSYTFFSFTFFFTVPHFHLALVAASISHFVTTVTKFSCCSVPTKKCLLCFLSLALNLCRPFSRWASLACRLLSLFLCLSLALYSKFVDMTINLSLILQKTRIQRQFPISIFLAFIDSLVVSALQDAGGYAISRQNNLELHLGCHTWWLSYCTLVCLWCGRTVSRVVYGFLPMVLRCALRARGLRYKYN